MNALAPPQPPDPTSSFGPWRVVRVLSGGGSGFVVEARHTASGRVAAVKSLHVLHPQEQEALRREVLMLSKLDHPGVVRILDSGVLDGAPWYAMELFRTPSLAERWNGPSRPPLAASLAILRDLAETLAFLHGEGIVHRDLKPANVMLRGADAQPVLVDFGFAARAPSRDAREPLESRGALLGTLAYMAPEQIRGEHVDARVDLYALGCMLHEAIAGEPPFGRTGAAVLERHLHQPPPPLPERTAHADLLPLRDALLAKDPVERIGYAEDVVRELARLLPGSRRAVAVTTTSYLYRSQFVGRRSALEAMATDLDRAANGAGALRMVVGESGSGKTRLAQEATALAVQRGFTVVLGECLPVGRRDLASSPLQPVAPLLRAIADVCRHEGSSATLQIVGAGARVLAPYEPSLTGVPGFDALPVPPALTGEAAAARVVAQLAASLRAFAARTPVLMVIDDLQWADEMTLMALESLAREAQDMPAVILCTARSEEATGRLEELIAGSGRKELRLEPLASREIATIVSDMLALREPPDALLEMLVRDSDGNPFFVAEYLRAAVAGGHLARRDGRWQVALTLTEPVEGGLRIGMPTTLRALVEQRLASVPAHAQTLLDAGAVLGRRFEAAVAGAVAGLRSEDLDAAITALVRRLILEETRGGLRFGHDQLREAAYAGIPADRRAPLHHRALRELEQRHAGSVELPTLWPQLAFHASAAGETETAATYFDLAGAHALEAGAYHEAYAALLRAWNHDPAPAADEPIRHARRARMLSSAAFGAGDLSACIEHGRRALATLDSPLPRSAVGLCWALLGEIGQRLAASIGVRNLIPEADPRSARANELALSLAQLATSFFFAGASLPTLVTILGCLREGEKCGSERAVVEASMRLGFVAGTARIRPLSRHYFGRAHRAADRHGDRRARALALYFDAMYGIGLGLWDHTRTLGDRAAALLDEIGDRHEAEVALTISSHGFFYSGRVDEADERVSSVLATATRRANRQHVGWGRFLRARTELVHGEPQRALALALAAHSLIRDLPDTLSNVMLEGTLALAAAQAGDPDVAMEAAERLSSRLARGERPATGQCLDGLGGVADALLCLLESRSPISQKPDFERCMARTIGSLQRFSWLFPIAEPAAKRSRARLLHFGGRHAAARRAWLGSIRSAQRLGMPLEEARAHVDLARVAADAARADRHRREARRLLEPLGCIGLIGTSLRASGVHE